MHIQPTERKLRCLQKSKPWCNNGNILTVAYDLPFILYWFCYYQTEEQSGRLFFLASLLSSPQSMKQNLLNCEAQLPEM